MVIRRRYKDALLKIQSSLNHPTNTESVREVKKNVYLLLRLHHSSKSHYDSKLHIKQYYEQAITEYGAKSFFEICNISQENPTNAVLALPVFIIKKNILKIGINSHTVTTL